MKRYHDKTFWIGDSCIFDYIYKCWGYNAGYLKAYIPLFLGLP